MDEETFQTNMNTLTEMVLDEERLVTYLSLSKDLCIHVNDSKAMLNKLVTKIRQEDPSNTINVTFIISGLTGDNKARTTVLSECDLTEAKKTFKTVFYEHIYSVGKGPQNVDTVAFLAVSKIEDFALCTGFIKSNSCVKRNSDELGALKSSSQAAVPVEQKPVCSTSKKNNKSEPMEVVQSESKEIAKVHETKSEPLIKSEVVSPKKKNLTSSLKPKIDVKKNGHKEQKGIAGFFSKSSSAPTKKVVEQAIKSKEDIKVTPETKNDIKVGKMDVDEDVVPKDNKEPQKGSKQNNKDTSINNSNSKETPKNKTNNTKNSALSQIKKSGKVDKKRKRVLHISDSESDGEKDPFVDDPEPMEHESEDEIPPTPATNTVKITSGIVNPRKRRKIIDKTYTDEEGYILTKKEEVYESCSDNEEGNSKENVQAQPIVKQAPGKLESPKKKDVSPKKNGTKVSKKKISPPQKGKQSTMMNFFKKV